MILVPMDSPGLEIIRPLTTYGHYDAPGGHAELNFENVRVPAENLLVGEGAGFMIAQGTILSFLKAIIYQNLGRLGPGRIHHCMRLIGHCERSIDLMKERLKSRVAFGRPLSEQGVWKERVGMSRVQTDQARLMTLLAAHKMDTVGAKVAAKVT